MDMLFCDAFWWMFGVFAVFWVGVGFCLWWFFVCCHKSSLCILLRKMLDLFGSFDRFFLGRSRILSGSCWDRSFAGLSWDFVALGSLGAPLMFFRGHFWG